MTWHIQFSRDSMDEVAIYLTPEAAIEAACRLIDSGGDVWGIGEGVLADDVDREQIARIYDLWARAEYPFGRLPKDG